MIDPTLAALIREKVGPQRFGIWCASGEGEFFEDGSEGASGCVVAGDGSHYAYWTGWGDGRVILAMWRRMDRHPDWTDDAEYREARRDAGLADGGSC